MTRASWFATGLFVILTLSTHGFVKAHELTQPFYSLIASPFLTSHNVRDVVINYFMNEAHEYFSNGETDTKKAVELNVIARKLELSDSELFMWVLSVVNNEQ